MFWFDPVYVFVVLIPTLVISAGVQIYLSSTYKKWSRVRNSSGETGIEVGRQLFARTSLQEIPFESVGGKLSDHFDPRKNVVRLSKGVASEPSVASMAIVAHELGHVQQHQQRSFLMKARGFLVPAVTVSPMISYGLVIAGLIFGATGLVWLGIAFFLVVILFMALTLPVEIDASRRGLRLLREAGLVQVEADGSGARAVLTAAALTYVAALVTAVLQLFYLILLARD
jgi:Zn-dependent membrane protease YugP